MVVSIALIGDYNKAVIAHKAIPPAIEIAAAKTGINCNFEWIATDNLSATPLEKYDALWCVPASPYKNMEAALAAIKHARESNQPFLGTCGGYQHAALEYARNALGYAKADMPRLIRTAACR